MFCEAKNSSNAVLISPQIYLYKCHVYHYLYRHNATVSWGQVCVIYFFEQFKLSSIFPTNLLILVSFGSLSLAITPELVWARWVIFF